MVHRPGVPSRKLVQMSDRSGVGAPTHDGADPDLAGPEDASDDAGSRTPSTDTGGSSVRRRGRDLFGAMLGAEPADAGTPPGVPDTATAADPADVRTPEVDPASANGASRARRRLTTRATATEAATSAAPESAFDEAPAVIDSSMDSGVVVDAPVEEPRRSRRGGLRARRVHRIIRRVDPWSVLKLSLIFYFCVWAMVVVSGVLIAVLHGVGETIFWVFGLALAAMVGPAQAASRSLLGRLSPAGRESEIFGLYATTGRAASFLAPLAFWATATAFGATVWGALGIALVVGAGFVLMLFVKTPADKPLAPTTT